MDSKTSDQKGEYFYKFYPPVLLLLGILAILGFRMAGVVGWSRYILFFFLVIRSCNYIIFFISFQVLDVIRSLIIIM